MKFENQNQIIKFFIYLIMIIIIGSIISIGFYYSFVVVDVKKLDMDLIIDDNIGFNIDTDGIHFGKILPGGKSKRSVKVNNNNNFPVKIFILNNGNISDKVIIEDYNNILPKYSNISISYVASPPFNTSNGYYEGQTTILIKRKIL